MNPFSETERAAVNAFLRAREHFERVARCLVTNGHELIAKEAQLREARAALYFRRDELVRVRAR
ncbi:MAG TPA: hypothetical protein VG652_01340 [Gaiellaceae bacterium]|nr:hypothetical protein [Gaiellaceae bacterium]